jgi:hypothetical protein
MEDNRLSTSALARTCRNLNPISRGSPAPTQVQQTTSAAWRGERAREGNAGQQRCPSERLPLRAMTVPRPLPRRAPGAAGGPS